MARAVVYAFLFAVPSGLAVWSGVYLLSNRTFLGLGFGTSVAVLLFFFVILSSRYGSVDEEFVSD